MAVFDAAPPAAGGKLERASFTGSASEYFGIYSASAVPSNINSETSMFSSHPGTPRRQQDIRDHAAEMKGRSGTR